MGTHAVPGLRGLPRRLALVTALGSAVSLSLGMMAPHTTGQMLLVSRPAGRPRTDRESSLPTTG